MADNNSNSFSGGSKRDDCDDQVPSSAGSLKISASKGIPDAAPVVADNFTTVVFGPSTIPNLANCLQTSVTDAISEAVSSLPLLGTSSVTEEELTTNSPSGYHKLLNRLQSIYISNLDRFVVYAKRNIFSIPPSIKGSSTQVQLLTNCFLHASSSPSANESATHSPTNSPPQPQTQKGMEVPSLDQIPGHDQLQALEQELEQARIHLKSAKEKGKLLRSHLDTMNKAVHLTETSSRGIKRMLLDEETNGIHETIQRIMSDKEKLAVMQQEGKLLMDKLDSIMHHSSTSGSTLDFQLANNFKKDSLVDSSKELVEERCEVFRTQKIKTDEVTNLASLLKKGKK